VELYIDRGKDSEEENLSIFDQLLAHQQEVEASFGQALSWQRLEGKRACRIRYTRSGGGYRSPEDQWPALIDATVIDMDGLEKALRPFLKLLKLAT
jgi:hypothetical protein